MCFSLERFCFFFFFFFLFSAMFSSLSLSPFCDIAEYLSESGLRLDMRICLFLLSLPLVLNYITGRRIHTMINIRVYAWQTTQKRNKEEEEEEGSKQGIGKRLYYFKPDWLFLGLFLPPLFYVNWFYYLITIIGKQNKTKKKRQKRHGRNRSDMTSNQTK